MSGFCGWIGEGAANCDDRDMLTRMGDSLPNINVQDSRSAIGDLFGISLRSQAAMGDLYADEDVVAAIEGYPSWTSPRLADLSCQSGHAQALAEAYAKRGTGLFEVLRGSFSFAVFDRRARRAVIAIDRMGIQPLCYAHTKSNEFVFGSTTDSIARHFSSETTLRLQSVYSYFLFTDRIPAPDTIYEEQKKLAPAHYAVFDWERAETQVHRYWSMPYGTTSSLSEAQLGELLIDELRSAIASNIEQEPQSKLGVFLSGGLDSSTVAGLLAQMSDGPSRTFTVGFEEVSFDERPYANLAATHFGTDHREFVLGPQHTLDAVQEIFRFFDEPFANSSALPAYYCARSARDNGVDIMLAGDGGDELFAGNERYLKDRVFDYYLYLPAFIRRNLMEPCASRIEQQYRIGYIRKFANYVDLAKKSVPRRMAAYTIFHALDPSEIFSQDVLAEVDLEAPLRLMDEIYDAAEAGSKVQRMMHLDLRITLADSDIRKVSRMCELAGVRVRYPFLHDALVEFSASIPAELLLAGGKMRAFYKGAMSDLLPREILEKPKHGFGLPSYEHARAFDPLRTYFCDCLSDLKVRGYFNADFLDRLIEFMMMPDPPWYGGVAWDFVALEEWLRSRQSPTFKSSPIPVLSAHGA